MVGKETIELGEDNFFHSVATILSNYEKRRRLPENYFHQPFKSLGERRTYYTKYPLRKVGKILIMRYERDKSNEPQFPEVGASLLEALHVYLSDTTTTSLNDLVEYTRSINPENDPAGARFDPFLMRILNLPSRLEHGTVDVIYDQLYLLQGKPYFEPKAIELRAISTYI